MWKKFLEIGQKYDIYFHAVFCCILTLILVLGLNLNTILACFITMCCGIAKEWIDYFRGGYGQAKDIVADAVGIVIGAVIALFVLSKMPFL